MNVGESSVKNFTSIQIRNEKGPRVLIIHLFKCFLLEGQLQGKVTNVILFDYFIIDERNDLGTIKIRI